MLVCRERGQKVESVTDSQIGMSVRSGRVRMMEVPAWVPASLAAQV